MEIVYVIVGVLVVLGVGLAIYEWRKKRVLMQHNLDLDAQPSAHLMAERERAAHRPSAQIGINDTHQ